MFDFFGFSNGRRKSSNADDAFIDAVKSYSDVWTDIFSKDLSCILACPASNTLGEDTLTREQVMAHILLPERKEGHYVNLCNQRLQLVGNDLVCYDGFQEQIKVKITSVESITNNKGQLGTIYRINRPLVGGIASPEEPEEVSISVMHKYVAMIRSFPEAEAIFHTLDKYISEVNFVGEQALDGFSKIKPSLQTSLQMQWSKNTERLYRCGALSTGLGNDRENSKNIIGQIVESYIMSATYMSIYPWIVKQLYEENSKILLCISNLQNLTQTDLGIRPEFQCPSSDSIKILKTLAESTTPLDKLIILKKTINNINECINKNIQLKYCNLNLELATDDIVLIVIWIILKTSRSYENIYYDLHYASYYHFLSTSKNQLGFSLCHFQVAMSWISSRAIDKPVYTNNKTDFYDFSTSPNIIDTLSKININLESNLDTPNIKDNNSIPLESEDILLVPIGICVEAGNFNARHVSEINSMDSDLIVNFDVSLSPRRSRPGSAINGKESSNLSLNLNKVVRRPIDNGRNIITLKHINSDDFVCNSMTIESESSNRAPGIVNVSGNANSYSVVTEDGEIYTWGQPYSGRLGQSVSFELDTFEFLNYPIRVTDMGNEVRFKQVSCGKQHMIAVTDHGEVYTWGDNRCAQLGLSTTNKPFSNITMTTSDIAVVMASSPTLVDALKNEKVDMVACGAYHSLCLTVTGSIYSWGRAANGRLGQFPSRLSVPVHSVGRPAIVRGPWSNGGNGMTNSPRVSGKHNGSTNLASSLIINKEKYNSNGNNISPNKNSSLYVQPKLIPNQSFRLELSDKVYVSNRSSLNLKQQGRSDSFDSNSSVTSQIIHIAAGFSHSIAVSSSGKVYSWGCGSYGRLGHGSHCDEYLPKQIYALNKPNITIVSASAGLGHSMFLSKEGFLFGCGLNDKDQVGITETANTIRGNFSSEKNSVLVPQPIIIKRDNETDSLNSTGSRTPKYFDSVSCGDYHTAAISNDGNVYIWGNSSFISSKPIENPKITHRLIHLSTSQKPRQLTAATDTTVLIL